MDHPYPQHIIPLLFIQNNLIILDPTGLNRGKWIRERYGKIARRE